MANLMVKAFTVSPMVPNIKENSRITRNKVEASTISKMVPDIKGNTRATRDKVDA